MNMKFGYSTKKSSTKTLLLLSLPVLKETEFRRQEFKENNKQQKTRTKTRSYSSDAVGRSKLYYFPQIIFWPWIFND